MDTESSNKSVFENFDELSTNVIADNVELAKEFLKEFDVDPEIELANGVKQMKRIYLLCQGNIKRSRDESLLIKLQARLKELIQKKSELTGILLKNALSEKKTSFQFRNLETWTDEEMKDVLQDLDLVRLMEELDNLEE